MDKDLHIIKKLFAVAWLSCLCAMAQTAADVPSAAAMNEAVELAKKYDTEQAPAFINGILNSAVKGEGLMK